jgi:hypothetical protein
MAFYFEKVKRHSFFMRHYLSAILIVTLALAGCRKAKHGTEEIPVAKAYGKVLNMSDIETIAKAAASGDDSVMKVNAFIDQWLRQQVLLYKAEQILDEEKKDVERQLEEYRKSLLVFNYEREYVNSHLDTSVSENEIKEFYDSHQDDFILKDNIIKVNYLILDKKTPRLEKVRAWFRSDGEREQKQLREYVFQYAINSFFDNDAWLLFDDLLKQIPIKTYDKEEYLRNNRFIEAQDSSYIYLVNIKGFKIKDGVSPLSFETENIRTMILNKRKLKLIEDMEKQLYDEALKKGDAEIIIKYPKGLK